MSSVYLSAMYIYPVKSLAGISLQSWPVSATGFQYDRRWMLIDDENQFLSQRRLPRMALINTALTERELVLTAPGAKELRLELNPITGKSIRSTIWHDQIDTLAVSVEADEWFSAFLGIRCRLVYQPDSAIRPVNPQFANNSDQTSLSDGFPFLLISENSLAALNTAMNNDMTMTRFRPNLVVTGCDAYAEDTWRNIRIGAIGFRLPKPCSRCSVPTIDPTTAETGKEPLTTLNRIRKWESKVFFGQNALHDNEGRLSVGDRVIVEMSGTKQPPL